MVFSLSAQTVTTDKLDYMPGETAYASGSGWTANSTITMTIHEEPVLHDDVVSYTTADAFGDFSNVVVYNFDETDFGSSFTLTATDGVDIAVAYFTDGAADIGDATVKKVTVQRVSALIRFSEPINRTPWTNANTTHTRRKCLPPGHRRSVAGWAQAPQGLRPRSPDRYGCALRYWRQPQQGLRVGGAHQRNVAGGYWGCRSSRKAKG